MCNRRRCTSSLAPVYVQPRPVYVQPQPVYRGNPHYAQRNGAWGDADRDGVPNIRDRDSRFYDARVAHRNVGWDADRDGVPNRCRPRAEQPVPPLIAAGE